VHPEVVIPDVQVENIGRASGLQRFGGLELEGQKVRLAVALLVIGEQEQIVAVVLLHSLGGVARVNNVPLHAVHALIRNDVLARSALPRTENLGGHKSS
jgi:hypothetical protein